MEALLAVLAILLLGTAFPIAYLQSFNAGPLWIRQEVDLDILGFRIPPPWFASLDALATIALAPVIVGLWRRQSKREREPGEVTKIAIGCALASVACLIAAAGSSLAAGGVRIGAYWPAAYVVLLIVGFLYQYPTTLALVSRVAPVQAQGTLIGCFFLTYSLANIVTGRLAALWSQVPHPVFWSLHAGIALAGAVAILLLRLPLRRALASPAR